MKLNYIFLLLFVLGGVAACADKKEETKTGATDTPTESSASSGKELAEQLRETELPENAPEIGTAIADVVKQNAEKDEKAKDSEIVSALKSDVNQIMWDDLVPEDYKPEMIMEKYQVEIQNVEEGSPEERILLKKMMAEFDSAPANETLNGKKVRIPGFVSPLDQSAGVVGEFLLVPYFGSCIHSPPPPVNQTILVKPDEGKSISMDEIYEPVWVTGYIEAEATSTSLAQAGYLIKGAELEKYTEENAVENN